MRRALLGVGFVVAACQTHVCPEIGCFPKIRLTFDHPVAVPYALSTTVKGVTLTETCPRPLNSDEPAIESCDALGFTISGVDLGHDNVAFVPVAVSLNEGPPIQATAKLDGIANSSDCDYVCYQHSGTLVVGP
jgi:hypothetical protein